MKIGIIGAGLTGLVAGKTLAEAGHEVTVFDAEDHYGGRLATRESGPVKLDYGISYLSSGDEEYNSFLTELESKNIIKPWCKTFGFHNGEMYYERHPGREEQSCYIAPGGMNAIARYLSRWLDFRLGVPVGGMTFIGANRIRKKPWMITLTDINVFELDAIIIATSAVQAHGLIQTSQDEYAFRRLVKTINQIDYKSCFSLMLKYGNRDLPDWQGIVCEDESVNWISNESSKRENGGELALVIQSTSGFAAKHIDSTPETVIRRLLEKAGVFAGSWAERPEWHDLHFWRYKVPRNSFNMPYLELEDHPAPVALIGDYFGGKSTQSAYSSGKRLARHWIQKFEPAKVNSNQLTVLS